MSDRPRPDPPSDPSQAASSEKPPEPRDNGDGDDNDTGNGGHAGSLAETLRRWLPGLGRRRNGDDHLREAIERLVEHDAAEAVTVSAEERSMLLNLLHFGDLRVDDVMVPRADVVAVELATPLDEVVTVMREAGHSRLPVYRGTLDDIVGMIHVRDLLRFWGSDEPFALTGIARRLLFVPQSMRVRDLLLQMRVTRIHMAVVVDEYGGTDGLVTIEDLVEEIVGEIQDEHDVEDIPLLVEQTGDVIEASARVPVEDLEARTGYDLLTDDQEEHIETLGGLVFSLVGRVPTRGEIIAHPSGLQFEVVDADPRRVKRLRIHNVPPAPTAD